MFLAKHKATNKVYAVKVLKKDAIIKQKEVKHIMSERNVLMNNHRNPFLIGLHYSFQTPAKLYFVLDYVNGGMSCTLFISRLSFYIFIWIFP